jgi:hypothetical protein
MGIPDVNRLFYRYPWIHSILWLLVAIWTLYFARELISNVTSTVWRCFTMILGWWWAVTKTVLFLCGQLCIAVPATGVAYLIALYVIHPILTISWSYFLDLVDLAMSPPCPPQPRSFQYTHTHSNGQSYTHTYDAEELEAMREGFQSAFEEKQQRERQERAEREMRHQSSARGTGKSKRKGKKRK